nr:olfactory receptor 39 [Gregopimpla kuwanae]
MQILSYSFAILTYLGGWRPVIWTTKYSIRLYGLFSSFTIFTIYTFAITEFIDLFNTDDVSELINNCFMLLSIIGACSKVTNVLGRRESILKLVDILCEDLCKPKNLREIEIQDKFERKIRRNTYLYVGLLEIATIAVTTNSLVNDLPNRVLPFKAWIPYNLETFPAFLLAYFHQTLANIICATVCAANETLVTGLMLQACAQLEILSHRLENLPKLIEYPKTVEENKKRIGKHNTLELKLFSDCIKHHHRIIEFSTSLNATFSHVIFVQFAISIIVVCTSLFKLSKMKIMSGEFLSMILYLLAILVQIFIYCWYGNEVMIKSIEVGNAAYAMDWTLLNVNIRKNILILMIRALRPIKFTSGYIMVLSIDSYNNLMKLSYSAYNGLQQSANR